MLLGAGLAQSVFAARALVAPRWNEAAVLATLRERLEDVGVTVQGTFGSDAEKASYLLDFAPDVARRLLSIHQAMADVDSSAAALEVRGARVRTDVIAPLEQVHDVVRRQTVTDAGLAATHQHLTSSVSESLGGAADVADGLENRDLALYRRGATRWVAAQQEFSEWLDGLTTLAPQPARD